jgi:hypothetical protein
MRQCEQNPDPGRLRNICVENVNDRAAYFYTWKYS